MENQEIERETHPLDYHLSSFYKFNLKKNRKKNETVRVDKMESELQRLLDVYYGNGSDARLKKVVETKLNEWKRRSDGKVLFFILFFYIISRRRRHVRKNRSENCVRYIV